MYKPGGNLAESPVRHGASRRSEVPGWLLQGAGLAADRAGEKQSWSWATPATVSPSIILIEVALRCSTLTFEPFFACLRKQIPCYVFVARRKRQCRPIKPTLGWGFTAPVCVSRVYPLKTWCFAEKRHFVALNAWNCAVFTLRHFFFHILRDSFYWIQPRAEKTRLIFKIWI